MYGEDITIDPIPFETANVIIQYTVNNTVIDITVLLILNMNRKIISVY